MCEEHLYLFTAVPRLLVFGQQRGFSVSGVPPTSERNNSDTLHQMPPAVERYGNYAPIAVMSAIAVDKPRLQSAAREGKEVENPMMSGIAQLLDLDRANELSSLQRCLKSSL